MLMNKIESKQKANSIRNGTMQTASLAGKAHAESELPSDNVKSHNSLGFYSQQNVRFNWISKVPFPPNVSCL